MQEKWFKMAVVLKDCEDGSAFLLKRFIMQTGLGLSFRDCLSDG